MVGKVSSTGIELEEVENHKDPEIRREIAAVDVVGEDDDPRLKSISAAIRVVPHFPKPGTTVGAIYIYLIFINELNHRSIDC